jgi:hypothetical protein
VPDPIRMLVAGGAAAATAFVILLLCGLPWRKPSPGRLSAGWVLGVAAGFYLGCGMLGWSPHWPRQVQDLHRMPAEAEDRLVMLLLPGALALELLVALAGAPQWLTWIGRLAIAAAAAPLLLYNSRYLVDFNGPGSRDWTLTQQVVILGSLAAILAAVWLGLARLAERAPGYSVPLSLAVVCAGAAAAVMLCGYATGGQLGVPLAGALAGTAFASIAVPGSAPATSSLGLGLVGLFSLLILGRFFGELPTPWAAVLFASVLLPWLPEVPRLRALGPRLRGLAAVLVVAIPVAVVLLKAQQQSVKDSQTSPTSGEASTDDYNAYRP